MYKLRMARDRLQGSLPPQGKYDESGRWYPSPFEHCECCDHIKRPTKNRPLSFLKHCRTRKHVTNLYNKYRKK